LISQPIESFSQALRFAGYEPDCARVERAAAFSSFSELKRQ
jgi:hypothetical protein